jgi:hypothetical protein
VVVWIREFDADPYIRCFFEEPARLMDGPVKIGVPDTDPEMNLLRRMLARVP